MKKIVTIVGARPQFIKAAPVSRALAEHCEEVLVHTGQHYDAAMSDVFFERLGIAAPRHHLGIGSASHGAQTGRMLEQIESVLESERGDMVLVYGDTNSTLAGALAASKLHIPVIHIEAGLRSFNRRMPEEINRVLTDHVSALLFAPTDAAVENLRREGIDRGVHRTGDVMLDAVRLFESEARAAAGPLLERWSLQPQEYVFATVHRAENTSDAARWSMIVEGIRRVSEEVAPVVWAVHPRVRDEVTRVRGGRIIILDAQPYFETQALVMNARVVLTDSGGLQKEAAFHSVPCVTLRDETEWVELTEAGVNRLAGADAGAIVEAASRAAWPEGGLPPHLYGDGHTSDEIARIIASAGEAS